MANEFSKCEEILNSLGNVNNWALKCTVILYLFDAIGHGHRVTWFKTNSSLEI